MKSIEKGKGLINIVEIVTITAGSADFKEETINLMMVEKKQ
jgi:hypothetical protein